MGVAELWTGDDTLYRFTESTSLNPGQGEIIQEPAELRRRMIHLHRTQPAPAPPNSSQQIEGRSSVDYAAMRPHAMDTEHPEAYPHHLRYALMVAGLCNNASVVMDEETKEWLPVGDPTEIALTVASQKGKLGQSVWKQQEGFTKVHERAFDSERKLMSSVYQQGDMHWVLCKGAPEELLAKCTSYLERSPSSTEKNHAVFAPVTDVFIEQVLNQSSTMASQGLRVLGLAFKKVSADIEKTSLNDDPRLAEDGFGFVALVGLMDPPKQGVKEAVETCQEAGIRVMMITGDHVDTATAIAEKLGIFKKDVPGLVSEGYLMVVSLISSHLLYIEPRYSWS